MAAEDKKPSASARNRFAIRRLTLTNFRCYDRLRLEVEAGPVVLCGPNGAGKTNILEALSLLVPGRGLRRARLSEIARRAAADAPETPPRPWAVAVKAVTGDAAADLGTGFQPSEEGAAERRTVKVNGEAERSQAALAEHMSVHWLTPQMDRLFQDGASARRRFLDRLVYGWDPAHAGRVSAYEQAMRERLKLLRGGRPVDPAWLSALEDTMAARGVAVAAARADVVARLAGAAAEPQGPFPGAAIALDGELDAWVGAGPALEAEDRFRAALADERGRDAALGRTHTGPHRTDLAVRHQPKDEAAAECSTGEQKALLIALVLANARVRAAEDGGVPVLLLDEVVAHLDAERRAALFDALDRLGAQVWFTGTDMENFQPLRGRAQLLGVNDARVTAA
ncbi:MAG: DNA replication/repair protein RecF [Magnetovibrio sp.]|nr:DNA replication/repair protein RecF [Magnetovibrio sp.]